MLPIAMGGEIKTMVTSPVRPRLVNRLVSKTNARDAETTVACGDGPADASSRN